MKTATWRTLHVFDYPTPVEKITFVDSPLKMPEGVDVVIRESWNRQLQEKQAQLGTSGVVTEIKPYHLDTSENPLNALYEDNKPKMWPGPAISLKDARIGDEGIELFVGQTYFPFINGLKEPKISGLYDNQGIPKPRPALAICTYALTQDGEIALTVRGNRTNMYPGRLYGQGGNPLFTNTNIAEHQVSEMKDEILVQPDNYDVTDMKFVGIVIDQEQLKEKPDLVGYVPVNLDSAQIREKVRAKSLESRAIDSIDVVFAPAREGELFDYLTKRVHPVQFCPPAHGGLVLFGHHAYGPQWSGDLFEKLQ